LQVNISTQGVNQANAIVSPTFAQYSTALRACNITIYPNLTLVTLSQTYNVEICGPLTSTSSLTDITNALLEAWLLARPEFVWCATQRQCLLIRPVLVEQVSVDDWNVVTRINYVVVVNGVTLDPALQNYAPGVDVLRASIQKLRKNLYQWYLLCGALVDTRDVFSFLMEALTTYAPFPLPLSTYVTNQMDPGRQAVLSSIQAAVVASNPYATDVQSLVVMINDVYTDVLVLKTFYDTIGVADFYINSNLV
jgi:hypothetical protein